MGEYKSLGTQLAPLRMRTQQAKVEKRKGEAELGNPYSIKYLDSEYMSVQ